MTEKKKYWLKVLIFRCSSKQQRDEGERDHQDVRTGGKNESDNG